MLVLDLLSVVATDALTMRIASISLVKDEADIFEAFVRHNLHFVDRMYVIDDRSTDNTTEILHRLASESDAVCILDDGWTRAFQQSRRTTAAMNRIKGDDDWDAILALDADELICAHDRSAFESAIASIPAGFAGGVTEIRYLAAPSDDVSIADPLIRISTALENTGQLFKSFATRDIIKISNVDYSEGNHHLLLNSSQVPTHLLQGVAYAHFAFRSPEQIAVKCLKHYAGWRSRWDYEEGMSPHLMSGARALKAEPSFKLSFDSGVISAYGFHPSSPRLNRPFVERRGTIKWPELTVSSPYGQLLGLFDQLIEQAKFDDVELHRELWQLQHSGTKLFKSYWALHFTRLLRSIKKRLRFFATIR